jgi:hypothetical protein
VEKKMEIILSVYFANDRTYISGIKPTETGIELVYINSTEHSIDLEEEIDLNNPEGNMSLLGSQELEIALDDLPIEPTQLTVTLPIDSVLISQFPGDDSLSEKKLKELVNLEIRQQYPKFDTNDFMANIIPLAAKKNRKKMMMGIIIPKKSYENCKKILAPLNMSISRIELGQLTTHSCFLYNYPEFMQKNVMLLGIEKKFADITVLKQGKPLYYNTAKFAQLNEVGEIMMIEFDKINTEYIDQIDAAFFYGPHLTKDFLDIMKPNVLAFVPDTGRVNAFRMMRTNLEQRDREYASRVSHIFPPCVGGAIPTYYKKLAII